MINYRWKDENHSKHCNSYGKRKLSSEIGFKGIFKKILIFVLVGVGHLYSVGSIEEEMEAAVSYYRELGQGDEITDSFEIIDEVHDCLSLFDALNETLTASWDIMYEVAKQYYGANGDLNVPKRYVTEEGYYLGPWLETQRRVRAGKTAGLLTPAQVQLLDALGMRWESLADLNWEKYYAAAKQYREARGDLLVPNGYVTPDRISLGNWIANLRTSRKSGIKTAYLTPGRIAALDALGMTWDVPDYLFERNYAAALEYYRLHEYVPPE